ncbi:replicative DNA helicase [Methylobacterium sp. PvR107]|uniref:replicative DNA helicase n=1 Tax=Methylobacterium sp. PvR107 TaxID=2806597 RepID=UPI001AE3B791|nr:replicative DNA helicase [Methylobacterium sp. PvR107]MBP1180006.1 replicative DNA helicase [Methylobacterium sp. PvR107]
MSALQARLSDIDDSTRRVPQNIDAEQALIGAVLINNDAFRKVSSLVEAEHFHEPSHRKIWEVVAAQIAKGQVANPITLKTYLGDENFGGQTVTSYLARLAAGATTVINAPDYARTVADTAMRRRLIAFGETIVSMAQDAPVEATTASLFSAIESEIEELKPRAASGQAEFRSFDDVANSAIERMCTDWQNEGQPRGLSTGLPALDEVMGGLEAPDLIIVGGRTAMGKTALALNIAGATAKELHLRRIKHQMQTGVVGFFSLEMGDTQLFDRMIAAETGIESWRIRRRKMTQTQLEKVVNTARDLRGLPLHIDETGSLTIAQLANKARSLKKRRGLELLVVDYLQLIKGRENRRDPNRAQEVTEISNGLKGLAKELHVPIIALAQVGRQVDQRDDKRPMLSDLRESGSIEQDADHVLFTYREEYYEERNKPKEGTDAFAAWERRMKEIAGVAEVVVAKNRHGRTGIVTLGYRADVTQFLNEPEAREVQPEQVRERAAKKPTFPAQATVLYGLLKSLTLTKSHVASNEQRAADRRLCKGARLIPLDVARSAFAGEVMPGETEEKVKSGFRAAFVSLVKGGVAFYHGVEETGFFVWLPEMVSE